MTTLAEKLNIPSVSFDKFFNYSIIAFAFVLPISKAGIVLFSNLLILLFLLKVDFMESWNTLKKSNVIIALFIFLGISILAISWSSDKLYAISYIRKYYHLMALPIIYLYFNPKYTRHVLTSFIIAILISELLSYGIYLELFQFRNVPASDPSPFVNHSNFSMLLVFAAIIIFNRVLYGEKQHRIVYVLFLLSTLASLFINGGRTGQFALIAIIFFLALINIKNKIKAIVLFTAISGIILVAAYNISPVFKDRGTQAYTDISQTILKHDYRRSFGIRVSLWIMGWHVFLDNFPLGTGIGDEKEGMQKYAFKYDIERYKGLADKGYIDYHSYYFNHLVQLGLPGLLAVIYLMYTVFTVKINDSRYRNINYAFMMLVFVFSTVGNILHTIIPMTFFAFFLGILLAISRAEKHN